MPYTEIYLIIDALQAIRARPGQFVREAFGDEGYEGTRQHPMYRTLAECGFDPVVFFKSLDVAHEAAAEQWIRDHIEEIIEQGGKS